MKRFTYTLSLILALAIPSAASAAPAIFKTWGGLNAVWFDDHAKPSEIEVGLTTAASLHENISVVGSGFVGLQNRYKVASIGPRVALGDTTSSDLSVALSAERQFSSDQSFRKDEWTGRASIGFRPFPDAKGFVLGVQAIYGTKSNTLSYLGAVRFRIGG